MVSDTLKRSSSTWGNAPFISLVINLLLLFTLSVTVLTNLEDAGMFSFGWTYRLNTNDASVDMNAAREAIRTAYAANTDSSLDHLGSMLDDFYDLARCKPALYDGGLEWSAGEISPTCNCVRNMHVEYVKSVRPAGEGLNRTAMNSTDTRDKVQKVTRALDLKCFTAVRHTQVRTDMALRR